MPSTVAQDRPAFGVGCTANGQNSFSVREFSQRFAEPLNRSSHVPVQRREHGERRESQRSYQRFRAGKSATTSVSASPQSSSARLCAALRSPRFEGHNRSHQAEAGTLRRRLRDRSFGCGQRLLCVSRGHAYCPGGGWQFANRDEWICLHS